jgi:hypothetical protein
MLTIQFVSILRLKHWPHNYKAESELEAIMKVACISEVQMKDAVVGYIGPHSGRDAALALGWLEVNRVKLQECGLGLDDTAKIQLRKHYSSILHELSFLRSVY